VSTLRTPVLARFGLWLLPVFCFAILLAALLTVSAADVRSDSMYVFLYTVIGLAWLGACDYLISLMGISGRDDVIERRNPAAFWIVCGAILANLACFVGGNVGDGPGFVVVVFSAALASGTLFLIWLLCEVTLDGAICEAITVERDIGLSLRWGCLLLAIGLILGWSVAGDWDSVEQSIVDFAACAWPAGSLAAFAVLYEGLLKKIPTRPGLAHSAFVGVSWIALAICYVALREGRI